MKLNKKQKEELQDYLRFVTFSEESLNNHILGICIQNDKIGLSDLIEEVIADYIKEHSFSALFISVEQFIESIDLDEITVNPKTLQNIKKQNKGTK